VLQIIVFSYRGPVGAAAVNLIEKNDDKVIIGVLERQS